VEQGSIGIGDKKATLAAAAGLLRGGRPGEAERLIQVLLSADPADGVAHCNLGVMLDAQGRLAEAAEAYRRAIALDPDHAEAHYNLGAALQRLGRVEDAASCFSRAIACRRGGALRPNSADACYGLGLALRRTGRDAAALAAFERALRLAPDHGAAAFEAGELYLWRGRTAESEHHLGLALRWLIDGRRPPARAVAPPRFDTGAARRALFALLDALEARGLAPFLNGGTALGCVREGDFIAFDKDIDVGVLPGTAPETVIDAVAGHPALKFLYHDTHDDQVLRVRLASDEGIGGDVFLYQEGGDGEWWCGVQRGPLAIKWRDTRFGLVSTPFLGRQVLVPDPVERYLVENYGDWRAPDPHHIAAFSAPNLIGGYDDIARCTVYASIFSALAAGNVERARRHCEEALRRDPQDALMTAVLASIEA